jgi:NAD(P)-dependent dehydrogenase (short-subunit alcohol dehydrogenase family)
MTDTTQPASRHAVVTGAANGIGFAIAEELALAGWDVTGVDMRRGPLEEKMSELADRTEVRTAALVGDLADEGFAEGFVQAAWEISPVDGLVNAAGIYPAIPFLELTAERWNRVQAVNVVAPLLATQALARLAVAAQRTPSIVNIASGAAQSARPGTTQYSTSKAALVMLTKGCAIELGPAGIRVNTVSPGFFSVDSEVNPISEDYRAVISRTILPGVAQPRYVAGAVKFLLGDDAHWITGANIPVDGGTSAGTRSLPQHWDAATAWQTRNTATSTPEHVAQGA